MHVQVLSSGSGGNSILVRHGDACVLVDAGLPAVDMDARLEAARIGLGGIHMIAVTHGHLDHTRSAGILARRWRVPVACAPAIQSNAAVRRSKNLATFSPTHPVVVDAGAGSPPLELHAVVIPHDASPTYAIRIQAGDKRAVVVTDMGRPDQDVARQLANADLLYLEFNYDEQMLANGPYPAKLKHRIRSGGGHLSNEQSATMLRWLASERLHTLVLGHLSEKNNTPELALATARATLNEMELDHVDVHVAEQHAVGPNLAV
jgi:phosphoribosyl 1,2-cyclic phosphodiesterase